VGGYFLIERVGGDGGGGAKGNVDLFPMFDESRSTGDNKVSLYVELFTFCVEVALLKTGRRTVELVIILFNIDVNRCSNTVV